MPAPRPRSRGRRPLRSGRPLSGAPLAPDPHRVDGSTVRQGTRRLAGLRLGYSEVAGPGRAFVLLHGFTGHRDDFLPRLPDLAGEAWLLAPDLRGHGDFEHTGRPESFDFPQLVDDLVALLDDFGIERCDLLGHSMGGMVALRFALAHPSRLASLVLMDTAPDCPEGYDLETFELADRIVRERGMAFLQQLVEKRWRESPEEEGVAHTRKWADVYWPHHRRRYLAMDPVAYGALGRTLVEQAPVVERLGEIACPTTVLLGDGDHEFVPGSEVLARGIPGAVHVTIPDAGHHPHMENPAAWLDAVRAHLRRVR